MLAQDRSNLVLRSSRISARHGFYLHTRCSYLLWIFVIYSEYSYLLWIFVFTLNIRIFSEYSYLLWIFVFTLNIRDLLWIFVIYSEYSWFTLNFILLWIFRQDKIIWIFSVIRIRYKGRLFYKKPFSIHISGSPVINRLFYRRAGWH